MLRLFVLRQPAEWGPKPFATMMVPTAAMIAAFKGIDGSKVILPS